MRVREPRFPSPQACLRVFLHGWTRWAGWPKLVLCDRRTHNRGIFGSTLAKNGVVIRPAGLEAPEQIGRVERRGAMHKKMMSKVIKDTHALGKKAMHIILSECLNAVNEMTRHGGFAPAQWVLSRLPRNRPPWTMKMNTSMWVRCKHMPMDQQLSGYSHITEQRHSKLSYDGTVVNESDALICERPHLWLDPTKLETIVSYCREARAGEHGLQWNVGSRLTSFEKDRNSPGETQPRTCWGNLRFRACLCCR